jgi:hypothetical protein
VTVESPRGEVDYFRDTVACDVRASDLNDCERVCDTPRCRGGVGLDGGGNLKLFQVVGGNRGVVDWSPPPIR